MPKGVEHLFKGLTYGRMFERVINSVMPKGVEHTKRDRQDITKLV